MDKILVSFATNNRWYASQALLNKTASKGGFTGYISYTDKNWNFKHDYDDISNTRGYGYWMWKPLIILEAMSKLNTGDIVGYIDSGNTVINSLDYIFDHCVNKEITLFDNRDGNFDYTTHKNKTWTKRDCFVLMGCDNNKYYDASQVDGSYQFYKKTDKTIAFLEEYKEHCCNKNIISDIPNITEKNLQDFKDHRHDQSILSLLAVKHNIELLPEPSEWGNYLKDRPYVQLFRHHRGII